MKIIFSLETGFLTGNNYIHTHAPTNQPASQPTNKQSRVSVSIQRPLSHSTSHRSTNRLKRPLYRPSAQPISLRMWCSFQIYRLINKTKAQKKTKSVVSKCCIVPSVLSSFCLHFTHAESMGWPNKSADFLYFKKIQPHGLDKKTAKKKICLWSLKSQVMTEWLLHLTDLFPRSHHHSGHFILGLSSS